MTQHPIGATHKPQRLPNHAGVASPYYAPHRVEDFVTKPRLTSGKFGFSRRQFTTQFLAGLFCAKAGASSLGQDNPKGEISQFDLSLLHDWITPALSFFIRSHFAIPAQNGGGWTVSLGGAVAVAYEVFGQDFAGQDQKRLVVTLECAENPVGGGLVSNAEWTGISLRALLEKARLLPEAQVVRLLGGDGYERIIPLSKAMHPDTLLVDQMNGDKLLVSHGGPLRALLPGWHGMDSVKWLRRIDVLAAGENQTYLRRSRSGRVMPITKMNAKSVFARPVDGAILFRRRLLCRGTAWAGEKKVHKVEVSTDGAHSWQLAGLLDPPLPYAWVRWEYGWKIPAPGNYELVVRATDESGRTQPADRDPDRMDEYEQISCQRVRVSVV
ncbi:MAG: molybdopterin-dependent oxidoreductase [Acidobacteria bacterium]|nr:molybdopterin-dependent oxidoreductase [Acidobacteriota bacterium]MCI0625243.1 molybdopterin-dependent oxidoreductase [Acidobacteriota bacterium]MCI0718803.1 molybdopterin-dependent oxidoreductase [Acidobacteriota bacterium]